VSFYGSELHVRLQKQAIEHYDWIYRTPGWCHGGRQIGVDDPDKASWDAIFSVLARDSAIGFRMLATRDVPDVKKRLEERGYRLDLWDVFLGDRDQALHASNAIVEEGLPGDLAEMPIPDKGGDPAIRRIQAFMFDHGVAPFPGSMLAGEHAPVATFALTNKIADIIATGHAYFAHNQHSPHYKSAWGGLIAVAESERGRGLGRYINAKVVKAAFETLGAHSVYELVTATNIASRRMVAACGLQHDPSFVSGGGRPPETGQLTK